VADPALFPNSNFSAISDSFPSLFYLDKLGSVLLNPVPDIDMVSFN
jgi:hypothetical protein